MPHPHGTINRYNNQRCRCDLCRTAIRDYRREQRAKGRTRLPPVMPAPSANVRAQLAQPTQETTSQRPKVGQLAKTSCGHVLYFDAATSVPLGGWVACPQHGPTGVREAIRAANIPNDALRGIPIAPQADAPANAAFQPIPARRPDEATPSWAQRFLRR